jgi:hypothetical protein
MIDERGEQGQDLPVLATPLIVGDPSVCGDPFEPLDRDQEPGGVLGANPARELVEKPSPSRGLPYGLLDTFKITIFNPQRWNGHAISPALLSPWERWAFRRKMQAGVVCPEAES